jgi:hypothetical protein
MWIALLLNAFLLVALAIVGGYVTTIDDGWAIVVMLLGLALADLPEPTTELVLDDAPLSWTTALPFRQPCLHVTTGLAFLLPDKELQAALMTGSPAAPAAALGPGSARDPGPRSAAGGRGGRLPRAPDQAGTWHRPAIGDPPAPEGADPAARAARGRLQA